MTTWRIHIEGQVQGVGFRPFVYRLARRYDLRGWVKNGPDGVRMVFNADAPTADAFRQAVVEEAPRLARITGHSLHRAEAAAFDGFRILHSEADGPADLLLSPDFALCSDCRRELQDPRNRRRAYPFITCTHCGPRYSIIQRLPYDRETTTMQSFRMCASCRREYENPLDRRYYSQTNSCPDCAIKLSLLRSVDRERFENQQEALRRVVDAWLAGEIVALKGIGGYLLTCDARNSTAIRKLRARKARPSKPLALMFPDRESLESTLELDEQAAAELRGPAAPIALLKLREGAAPSLPVGDIAPGLSRVGAMLPYAPLFELLLRRFGGPVVATSGNVSGSPIIYEDQKAETELTAVADWILTHNRPIVLPQDDSVVQYTPRSRQRIVLRRSRGLAPTYLPPGQELPKDQVLAMGAMLKSAFTLLHRGKVYISQYLGDLDHFETEQNFRKVLAHLCRLFESQPAAVLVDTHPDYPSTRLGEALARHWGVPVQRVQHHLAHFGAVLGEHHLQESPSAVLGVVWDGTGLGEDGQIWGGEFFLYEDYAFRRIAQLEYFDFLLGDKMPREPRISALAAAHRLAEAESLLRDKFNATEWRIYRQLLSKPAALQTSSVGRLFDAVAALLGLADRQSYEGEAAMRLEALAHRQAEATGDSFPAGYPVGEEGGNLPTTELMRAIIRDRQKGVPGGQTALRFHATLVDWIARTAGRWGAQRIAFSGGVFQNAFLVDLILHRLSQKHELFFHEQLSPNDECVSFGQLICHYIRNKQHLSTKHKSDYYVLSDTR